jgi:hypothetical protein
MRRIVMLAVVALMMSLMMALAGPALAAHGGAMRSRYNRGARLPAFPFSLGKFVPHLLRFRQPRPQAT